CLPGLREQRPARELHGGPRLAAQRFVGLEAALAEKQVRVEFLLIGRTEETDLQPRLERQRQEAQCRLLAGAVAIEEALHLAVVPAQQPELRFSDRGPL